MSLDSFVDGFAKTFGIDSFYWAKRQKVLPDIDHLKTGLPSLDIATGLGGLPRGRFVEIFGPESSGKTTLCQHIIAAAQRQGGQAGMIDLEGMDPTWAQTSGVDMDELYIANPTSGNQALDMAGAMIKSNEFDVVVLDSVAGIVTEKEQAGDSGDATYGGTANILSQFFRKWGHAITDTKTVFIMTNQLRQKMSAVAYGDPYTTTGGLALKFWAAQRLKTARIQTLKSGEEVTGIKTKVLFAKNKVAPPFRQAVFDILVGKGVSVAGDVLDLAVQAKLVEKRGAFYSYGDTRLGQGRPAAVDFLENDPTILQALTEQVEQIGAELLPQGKVEGGASEE